MKSPAESTSIKALPAHGPDEDKIKIKEPELMEEI
jgi:hypothetical protein